MMVSFLFPNHFYEMHFNNYRIAYNVIFIFVFVKRKEYVLSHCITKLVKNLFKHTSHVNIENK